MGMSTHIEFKWTADLLAEFIRDYSDKEGIVEELMEQFIESKNKKPLFTTKDNISVFDKDTCWAVRKSNYCITPFQVQLSLNNIEHSEFWYFGREDNAKDWILHDKPLLSLNEIEQIGQIQDSDQNIYFKRLINVAKDKLNK